TGGRFSDMSGRRNPHPQYANGLLPVQRLSQHHRVSARQVDDGGRGQVWFAGAHLRPSGQRQPQALCTQKEAAMKKLLGYTVLCVLAASVGNAASNRLLVLISDTHFGVGRDANGTWT